MAEKRTYVLRIRLPRDRSFIYVCLEHADDITLTARLIRRRYWSKRRVELMRLVTP